MAKYYYAFKYSHELDTTIVGCRKISGRVLIFKTKLERDSACNDRETQGTRAVTQKEISKMGHVRWIKHEKRRTCVCFKCNHRLGLTTTWPISMGF